MALVEVGLEVVGFELIIVGFVEGLDNGLEIGVADALAAKNGTIVIDIVGFREVDTAVGLLVEVAVAHSTSISSGQK